MSGEIDYKKLYEQTKKQLDKERQRTYAMNTVEDAYFELLQKRFDNEYYKELWDDLIQIANEHYIHNSIKEEVMERRLKNIDIDYYFPPKSEEEETEENYRKYYGSDSD